MIEDGAMLPRALRCLRDESTSSAYAHPGAFVSYLLEQHTAAVAKHAATRWPRGRSYSRGGDVSAAWSDVFETLEASGVRMRGSKPR